MRFTSFKEKPTRKTAMGIAVEIFKLTESLPKKEDYGLTSQIRRSALSISGNIAEAFGRNHTKDRVNFYSIARRSATEPQNHIEYMKRVGYGTEADADSLDSQPATLFHDLNKIIVALTSQS